VTTTTKPASRTFSGFTQDETDLSLFRESKQFNLLLAIENDDIAPTAIRLASALTAHGARPSVFRALEVMAPPLGSDDASVLFEHAILGKDLHVTMEHSLRKLITDTLGHSVGWPVKCVGGNPSECILEEADLLNARAIVMGIHSHGAFSQAIGENTATRVLARTKIPVIAVRPGHSSVPKKIMVAVDFGFASRKAAHIAANLADPDGRLILVHCAPTEWIVEEGDEGAALVQREGIEHAFQHLVAEISKGRNITIETMRRTGDPQTELMAAADAIAPDLLSVASHRHHLTTRVLIGSVARKLVREGKWSMLVVPPISSASYRRMLNANNLTMTGKA
jgi:nucleotide-binding universal stress UspA family protein